MNRLKLQVTFAVIELQFDNQDVVGFKRLTDLVQAFDSWIEVETFLHKKFLSGYRYHIIDVVPIMKTFNEILQEEFKCVEEIDVESEHQEEEKTEDVSCSDVADVTSQDNLDIF